MADSKRPNAFGLHRLAYGQDGYFTARQARECGFSAQLLDHHLHSGRYERMRRGLYRLRGYPGSSHEQVRASWLVVGADRAVVSHESALELHELSDVLPAPERWVLKGAFALDLRLGLRTRTTKDIDIARIDDE
jgi:predicted transcriptional regulator of viral defense system